MPDITVIDAHCGAGKTRWAIQEMQEHPDDSYIFCTPFLDEIGRIRGDCGKGRFVEPTNVMRKAKTDDENELEYDYIVETKIESFNNFLAMGDCVAVTHSTFLNATETTIQNIKEGEYTLIIDEVLDVIQEFNKIQTVEDSPKQSVQKGDIDFLKERGAIEIREDNRVVWKDRDYGDYKYSELKRLADMGRLYLSRGRLLVTVFPPEVFDAFKKVYILTYMFEGSSFMCYLKRFGFQYQRMSVVFNGEKYELIEYSKDIDLEFRAKCKELISICNDKRLNKERKLTKTWYDAAKADDFKSLKNDISTYFKRYLTGARASNMDIMWTCFKQYKDKLKGTGYTVARSITNEERKKLTPKEYDKLVKMYDCFVPCNARATNNYRNRWALAYCVNMYMNKMIIGFFDDCPEKPSDNVFALSSLIQWMFRSRIRDGLPISIYIPSKRMRELLELWLDGDFL